MSDKLELICEYCNADLTDDLIWQADSMNAHVGGMSIENNIMITCYKCGMHHLLYVHWTIDRIESVNTIGYEPCEDSYDTLEEKYL
jgi:hypothetical protein